MIVSLRSKQVGLWGYVALLDVKREKDDPKEGSIIHHVIVTTEEIDCKSERKEKMSVWSWELTEDYGNSAEIVEMIQMMGLGRDYKDYERIVQTVRGEWWVQKVKDAAAVTHRKDVIVNIPAMQTGPSAKDIADGKIKEGDVEVTVPNALDGSKEAKEKAEKDGKLHGSLEAEALSAKKAYQIEYQWRKCNPPGGDMTFK
jgi:hypothetical protein